MQSALASALTPRTGHQSNPESKLRAEYVLHCCGRLRADVAQRPTRSSLQGAWRYAHQSTLTAPVLTMFYRRIPRQPRRPGVGRFRRGSAIRLVETSDGRHGRGRRIQVRCVRIVCRVDADNVCRPSEHGGKTKDGEQDSRVSSEHGFGTSSTCCFDCS